MCLCNTLAAGSSEGDNACIATATPEDAAEGGGLGGSVGGLSGSVKRPGAEDGRTSGAVDCGGVVFPGGGFDMSDGDLEPTIVTPPLTV